MSVGVIFVAGIYGVGKSTLCRKLSMNMGIPFYSAGDLISGVNGEKYGANKAVGDKDKNQQILVSAMDLLLKQQPHIVLAGHFCIFTADNSIELLPRSVFHNLHIETIILLEAEASVIQANLQNRDNKQYSLAALQELQAREREVAYSIAAELSCKLVIHNMEFSDTDVESCMRMLK